MSDHDDLCPAKKRSPSSKTIDRETLASVSSAMRSRGLRIVTTNGSYDLLHAGHVRALHWSSQQGDVLIVGINSDSSVRAYKGVKRPIVSQAERVYQVASLECVDYACIFEEDEIGEPLLRTVRPSIHTTGFNWIGRVPEQHVIDELGVELAFVPQFTDDRGCTWSTTDIVDRIAVSLGADDMEEQT